MASDFNGLCVECDGSSRAEWLCLYDYLPVCSDHQQKHRSKRAGPHDFVPTMASRWVRNPGYRDRLEQRKASQAKGEADLNLCRENIHMCIRLLHENCNKLIKDVQAYRRQTLHMLQGLETEISMLLGRAVAEVQTHYFDDNYRPASPVAQQLWKYDPAYEVQFRFYFNYEVIRQHLSSLLQYEKPDFHVDCDTLAIVDNLKLSVLNNNTMLWQEVDLRSPTAADSESACVWLPEDRLFVCGARYPTTPKASIIFLKTGQVQELAPMTKPRARHGAVYCNDNVYVFGGWVRMKDCEKYSFLQGRWTKLPDMPHYAEWTTPCLYRKKVYLCGCSDGVCQVFDISSEVFAALPFVSPRTKCATAVFVANNELVILQRGRVSRWAVGSAESLVVTKIKSKVSRW